MSHGKRKVCAAVFAGTTHLEMFAGFCGGRWHCAAQERPPAAPVVADGCLCTVWAAGASGCWAVPPPKVGPAVPATAPCPPEASPADLVQMKVKLNEACSELQSTRTVRSGQAAEGLILYSTSNTSRKGWTLFIPRFTYAGTKLLLLPQFILLDNRYEQPRGCPGSAVNKAPRGKQPWSAEEPVPAPGARAAREGRRSVPGPAQRFNLPHQNSCIYTGATLPFENLGWIIFVQRYIKDG